jgi:hypothetical protein
MTLPYRTESLDAVPEAVRELYEEQDGVFVLPVDGAVPKDQVSNLESALDRLKEEKSKIKQMNDKDLKELTELREARRKAEEEKAKEEGRWDELRAKLQQEHEQETTKLQKAVADLTVTSELQRAISEAGVKPEYYDAVEALMLRKGPKVEWSDGTPKGVFRDEVHGPKPIAEFVAEWAKSDDAARFMPPETGSGGGGTGERGRSVTSSKPYAEMSMDEKAAYLAKNYATT